MKRLRRIYTQFDSQRGDVVLDTQLNWKFCPPRFWIFFVYTLKRKKPILLTKGNISINS